jgi:hypothetical protein
MRYTNGAWIIVVGPLGFEPKIASAPGWYPCPNEQKTEKQTRRIFILTLW